MQVVCEATQSMNVMVRVAALQCLVKIMSLHYIHMETYMAQALFAVSVTHCQLVLMRPSRTLNVMGNRLMSFIPIKNMIFLCFR